MRALVFFPEPSPHNDVLRKDLKDRFDAAPPAGFSAVEMIDAHKHHHIQGWTDLRQVVRLYRDTFDCVVFAMEKAEPGKMLSKLEWGVQDLKKIDPGLPLIGYVSERSTATQFNLLASQIPSVVAKKDNKETLAALINVAVIARAEGKRFTEIGPLTINTYTGDTFFSDMRVNFTPMQTQIIKVLVRHPGETVSRETLIDRMYGDSCDNPDGNTIEVQLSRMRKTLDTLPTGLEDFGRVIQTVRGGIRLVEYSPDLPNHKPGSRPAQSDRAFFSQDANSPGRDPALQIH